LVFGVVGVDAGHPGEGAEARALSNRTDHRSGAKADAESEQRQAGQPVVSEKRGGRVPDVLDVRLGVLELARLAIALAEVTVVERQRPYPRSAIA
jgi:hypothetical protein